ncbi:MAG: DM13 domain-containing protein [Pseudomonadota bacterium]
MKKLILLLISHGAIFAIGFGLGIYLLPILTAPPAPDAAELQAQAAGAVFEAEFTRDLEDSDFAHWGEGQVSLTETQIVHMGKLSPGPDFYAYLMPSFVETKAGFEAIKDQSVRLGMVKSFSGFVLDIPEGVDINAYNTVLIWCEAFGVFITAAQYR